MNHLIETASPSASADRRFQTLRRVAQYFAIERGPGAIKGLDGLRGIAILLVLGRHAIQPFYNPADPVLPIGSWDASIPFINGWMGVDLFFVLSGFLISHHIISRWSDGFRWADAKSYILKRVLRIVPAYYCFMLVAALGWLPFYAVSADDLIVRIAYHLLFLQDYLPANIVVPFWSLGVEEKFYMFVPLLVVPLARARELSTILWVLGAMALMPLASRAVGYAQHTDITTYEQCFWILRSPFHFCCDSLLVGTMTAFVFARRDHCRRLREPAWIPKAMFWCGVVTVGSLLMRSPLLETIGWLSVTVLFSLLALGFGAILMALVLDETICPSLFQSSLLMFFSKISYSLYLVHIVLVESTSDMLNRFTWYEDLAPAGRFGVYFPVFCALSILAALVLHYAVEKPFLILKDRVGRTPVRRLRRNGNRASE